MNELDKLTSLFWWQNHREAMIARYATTPSAADRVSLLVSIGQADDAIARMAATMSAQAKADLARMDAEDAAEVCS